MSSDLFKKNEHLFNKVFASYGFTDEGLKRRFKYRVTNSSITHLKKT